MSNLLIEFFGKTINIQPESISELLYKKNEDGTPSSEYHENALENLLNLDRERVAKLKQIDNADIVKYKKIGKAEALTAFEASLKEAYQIEGDLKGDDLINAIIAKKAGSQLDEDKIKVHPLYMSVESRKNKELADLRTELEGQLQAVKSEYAQKEIFSRLDKDALDAFYKMEPILPSDPVKAANQRNIYLEKLRTLEWQDVNGEMVAIKDGKRLEDQHGNPMKAAQIYKKIAEDYFEFPKQGAKGTAGNNNGEGGEGGAGPTKVPTNDQEFNTQYFSCKTAEERTAVAAAYEKYKAGK